MDRKLKKRNFVEDEERLSDWMRKNLLVYYIEMAPSDKEVKLIHELKPLLNIQDNNYTPKFKSWLKEKRK